MNKIDSNQPTNVIEKQVADIKNKAKKAMMNGVPIRSKDIAKNPEIGKQRAFELWDKIFNK
ncbi:hypothetical protein [Xenorhabdus vietnamensis]|uniref:hypothetical protein n=1 Tax=Xenorhabdus vietnamensis TaxID=351656 RepID=UPI000A325F27|nr:hypothetical protein [Xenorhabdus vietnamensis]